MRRRRNARRNVDDRGHGDPPHRRATRDRVRALVTAEGIASWYGPADIPAISAASDPRVGGGFEARFRTTDGREHVCAGEFLEIVRPEHLVMSWRWVSGGEPDEQDRVSRLEFRLRAIDIGTELTLLHSELHTEASARSHESGWSGALVKLTRRLGGPK